MKDYYRILGIPENSDPKSIKRAFRKLAFKYHPDTNPGNEKQTEDKFKEINEAYGVLGDEERRRQYDLARKGAFACYGNRQEGFGYSQQDIFTGVFSNSAMFNEMNRMFAQAGLRFDRDFLNRVFFTSSGSMPQFYTTADRPKNQTYYRQRATMSAYKPGLTERFFSWIIAGVGKFVMKMLFGFQYDSLSRQNLDYHTELEISPDEAAAGGEKLVTYKRNGQDKKLVVKVPSGVKPGTRIRLKHMGMTTGDKSGDLYLHIRLKD